MFTKPKRVREVPPYIFETINQKKKQLIEAGIDVIDLGIGCPDLPTPPHIVTRLIEEMGDDRNFKYSTYRGCDEFREAVAAFYRKRFDSVLDPKTDVLTLIGSKEGLGHLIPAVIDPGDIVLIPNPGYPVYGTAVHLSGGIVYDMPLLKENQFRPDFSSIPSEVADKAKLMILNYPGNPTAATVDLSFFESAVAFAKENDIIIAHDAAYQMVTFDGYKAPSILQVKGAMEVAVEFGSLSKTYNMTGWRIGYAVGNKDVLDSLLVVKSNLDTGQFLPIQKAGATALTSEQQCVEAYNSIYKERMEAVLGALWSIGIEAEPPRGSFFIWAAVPSGYDSQKFAERILEQAGVVVTPGTAFGKYGEGYFRLSLSVPTEKLKEAMHRLKANIATIV
ncbi:LL-diaminopimelate aminotransferase [Aneurinibacillus sp. REN35]|uniref:LL-diaminopimelate aminotransferase n=1 Tax=Aneurinibacillus sp. REN35 TaxID=3237286 RepID=UPI003527569E